MVYSKKSKRQIDKVNMNKTLNLYPSCSTWMSQIIQGDGGRLAQHNLQEHFPEYRLYNSGENAIVPFEYNQNGHKSKLQQRTLFLNCRSTGQSHQQKPDTVQQFKKSKSSK